MTGSLVAVLGASLLGSLHCVAMCGPLAALHLAPTSRATLRLGVVHALGRAATYVALGVGAGAAGRALDLAGDLASVQRAAAIVAGLAILIWGLVAIARVWWPRERASRGGAMFSAGLVRLGARRPTTRAAMLGVTTIAAPLLRRLRARLPVATALVLVALGVVTLAGRWTNAGAAGVAHPTCHSGGAM